MSEYIEILAIVEGKTEEIFINTVLQPYLAQKMIFMTATQVSKSGQKGGDVRFSRIIKDIERHLKQRSDTFVTTLIDYYGVKEWPGLEDVPLRAIPSQIANTINNLTQKEVNALYSELQSKRRFIPYMAIHEFEALLFSDSAVVAKALNISKELIEKTLAECGEPEAINNSRETAPSKRLNKWSKRGKFAKTTVGIAIAQEIGIDIMREKCPTFNSWLTALETVQEQESP